MKVPAIKYRVVDNTTGQVVCVIAVKKSDVIDFSPSDIAQNFANSLERSSHQAATVQAWEEDEFDFSVGEDARLAGYTPQANEMTLGQLLKHELVPKC